MKGFWIGLVPIICQLFTFSSFAQTSREPNIPAIQALIADQHLEEALVVLDKEIATAQDNYYLYWLQAQVCMQLGNTTRAYKCFDTALSVSNRNQAVLMDYGRVLFQHKRYTAAMVLFDEILRNRQAEAIYYEALMMKGYTLYYQGDLYKSKQIMQRLLADDPTLDYIQQFVADLTYLLAPAAQIGMEYASDDQPVEILENSINLGLARSRFVNPSFKIVNNFFASNPSNDALKVLLGNTFHFQGQGLMLEGTLGFYQHFTQQKTSWLGGVKLQKRLADHLQSFVFWERSPYLGTRYSTTNSLLQHQYGAGLGYDNPQLFQVSMRFSQTQYDNKNSVASFGGWLVSRPLVLGITKWSVGYGFSYANAKELGYVPADGTTTDIPIGTPLPGVYAPYYTPDNEIVHAVIGEVQVQLPAKINFSVKATYGVDARNNVPLLYRAQENAQAEQAYTAYTYRALYHPLSINLRVAKQLTTNCGLQLYYQRQNTFYYSQDRIGVNLSFKFL